MPSANGTVADREAPDAQASNEGVEMASMHMSSLNDQGLLEILMEYAVVNRKETCHTKEILGAIRTRAHLFSQHHFADG